MRFLLLPLLLVPLSLHAALLEKRNVRPLDAESTAAALEPWETPVAGFFVRNHHEVPIVDVERWELVVDGLVERPLRLSLRDLKQLSKRSLHAVLECSGNGRGLMSPTLPGIQWTRGAVGNAEWTGVALADVLRLARVKPEARFARVEGADKPALPAVPGFVRSVPLSKLTEADTLLAWAMNREPMPLLHGGPLRLILPRWYGQNWIKWVTHLTLSAEEDAGFYMKKGYRMPKTAVKPGTAWDSATGTPVQELRVQSLVIAPSPGARISGETVEIRGKAFSGAGTIARVEASFDEGRSWQPTELEPARASGGWQSFRHVVPAGKPGPRIVWTRATDSAANTQPLETEWNPSGYLRNGVDRVAFEIIVPRPPGEILVEARCRTCHSLGLVYGQTLSREGWEKSIKKMEGFGARIEPDERAPMADFLAREGASRKAPPETVDFAAESARFAVGTTAKGSDHGHVLYTARCAACHGAEGEGGEGPRLLGRAVPKAEFVKLVREGRGNMPGYDGILSLPEIDSIARYVQRPSPVGGKLPDRAQGKPPGNSRRARGGLSE